MAHQIFQLPFHRFKDADLLVDLAEPFPPDCDDLLHLRRLAAQRARHGFERPVKIKKLPDFGQGEANLVVATDEEDAVQITLLIIAISGGGSRRGWQQLLSFIKPNCLNVHASRASQLSNLHSEIIHPMLG